MFVFDKTNQPEIRVQAAKNALKRCKTLRHPCLIRVIEANEQEAMIYIVTERISRINFTSSFTEDQIALGLYQIAVCRLCAVCFTVCCLARRSEAGRQDSCFVFVYLCCCVVLCASFCSLRVLLPF